MTVTDAQKELNFLPFPMKLFNDVEALESEPGQKYEEFLGEYDRAWEDRGQAIRDSYPRPDYGVILSRLVDTFSSNQMGHAVVSCFS